MNRTAVGPGMTQNILRQPFEDPRLQRESALLFRRVAQSIAAGCAHVIPPTGRTRDGVFGHLKR